MRFLTIVFCLLAIHAQAQNAGIELLQNLKPRAIGPAGMSGRVTSIAVGRANPSLIYIGTASGGIWKSTDGGLAWEPVFDKAAVSAIGAVAIQQSNTDVVWAGTGEGNPRNSHNSGKGIYRSLDAGRNWTLMGLEQTRNIHRVIIHPSDPNIIYAAAMGSTWGPNPERGVFKTTDGGKTWKKILFSNNLSGCAELVMEPQNPNKLFAALWEHQRKPYTFNSGGAGSGFYMSVDGGENWKKLGSSEGLPDGKLGRIGIAIAPGDPNKVYAIIEHSKLGLYASENGGYTWEKRSEGGNLGNRPFYYNEIYVDPANSNHIFSLWSQVTHSIDGGKNWSTILDWGYIHPDHHAFYIHPDNPNLMLDGNDGGLNISHNGGKSWRYVANLPVGQFYHVNVDNEIPYNIYGGLQDNGSWRGPAYTWTEGGIRNAEWKELLFGDGFDVLPLAHDAQKGYGMYQGGNLHFWDLRTGRNQFIMPQHPDGKYLRYNWNAAIALHPAHENGLYYGSQFLHKSYNNGLSWSIISPDLTTNDTAKLHQAKSGGLTIDATNAENYCTIISIATTFSDTNVIWVGTDDGNLQLTRDGGKNWKLIPIPGAPKNGWIPQIQINKNKPGEIWVVMNNYRQNDWETYLYKTTDFGATWKRMADGTKVSGHALSVMPDPKEPNLVFLGTDHGLWVSLDAGNSWKKWTYNMPSVPVQDMVIQEREYDLVIATFGRSIFVFDDITPFRKLAAGFKSDKAISILSAGDGTLAYYSRPTGERFGADALFEAPNKPYGIPITLYTAGTKDAGKWKKQNLTGYVYDAGGKLIRTHKFSFDSAGVYRFSWRMISDGFRFPAHSDIKADDGIPAGLSVAAGNYKLRISDGKNSDSIWVNVHSNPAVKMNATDEQRKAALYARLKITVERAAKAFDALKDAGKIVETLTTLSYSDDSAQARLKRNSKPLIDTIARLKDLFMSPEDFTAYDEVTQRLMSYLYNAYGIVESNLAPASNAENALLIAERETDAVLKKVNTFFTGPWADFRAAAEKEKIQVFKNFGGY